MCFRRITSGTRGKCGSGGGPGLLLTYFRGDSEGKRGGGGGAGEKLRLLYENHALHTLRKRATAFPMLMSSQDVSQCASNYVLKTGADKIGWLVQIRRT